MGDSISWIEWFLSFRGNELFCAVEEDFITDRFNITGIGHDIPQFKKAYELISGSYGKNFQSQLFIIVILFFLIADLEENDGEIRNIIEKSARHTYGLIHCRFILTAAGLEKMCEKYDQGVFGTCPRVLCNQSKLLPIGISDIPGVEGVKLFCPHCEDIYSPKSGRHGSIDGAYFGTTFAHMFIQAFPNSVPQKKSPQKYIPKIFGFRIADRVKDIKTDQDTSMKIE